MATNRIRTLEFLPEIFRTPSNAEFLGATLDQLVNPPNTMRIQGYVGSKFGYGVNAKDYYVTEPTKTRRDYQLDPGVVFTKKNQSKAQDFITYPGIIDSLNLQGGVTDNNSRLFESQFYSWDSFTSLDKIINFNQYYWLPDGAPAVTVASATVFATNDYVVTDLPNGYNIRTLGAGAGTLNPTLTFLRGGTYRFIVNQDSQFWIQGEPGVSGYSPTQPNLPVRDVFGVSNNGASQGIVTFTVPAKNAQDEYIFPGNNLVDVVSTTPFSEINGQRLADVGDIDGITSLNGLRVMFYNTGIASEIGYVSSYFGETNFDVNDDLLVAPLTLTVSSCNTTAFSLASGTTEGLVVGQTVTFDNPVFGGITGGQVYYVHSIPSSTTFTIATTLTAGSPLTLTAGSGTMTVNINQGLYEEGFYTTVNQNFYRIEYVGNPDDPVLRLIPDGIIPTEQKITAQFGTEWIDRLFYRNTLGVISLVPYISAPLDVLYYQDGTSANKVGIIRIIESNTTNTLDIETDVLGQKNFTSTNGVVFTNGLKVEFDGDVIPSSYLQGQYYVEGVGSSIELIPVDSLICPEGFTQSTFIPFDTTPYDIGNFDSNLFVPVDPDYITIARNSISKNAWSRSNRWFHIDVINNTASYNNNPDIVTTYATANNKAKRPIIEFYPNLKLFNSGAVGKKAVDFIDTRTTDALSTVANQENYYPDVEVYTGYVATIASVVGTSTTVTVDEDEVTGTFQIGMYVTDSTNLLPNNSQISAIAGTGTGTLTLTISWSGSQSVGSTADASIIGTDTTVDNFALFPEARVIFAADTDASVRNKIYVVNFSTLTPSSTPVITLTVAEDGECVPNNQVAILRGYNYEGDSFYYDGIEWIQAQQKVTVNQAPLFDIYDENGISFGDTDIYRGTSFAGCTLFQYGIGSGLDDSILGFPIRYSSIDNVGDISFDITLNNDTFDYVRGTDPITQKVNTGYVFNYNSIESYARELGWQTAIAPSVQYQLFSFDYSIANPTSTFTCDVAMLPELADGELGWPRIQVYNNNEWVAPQNYTVTIGTDSTTVNFSNTGDVDTVFQILVLSNQVSNTAYYTIPINLNNNPFNADLTTANIGDIRSQYQDIFINAPGTEGPIFGSNNFRDLGNLVPYGTKIIQNSASLVLPGTFLRKQNHNLFDALLFNSREYIKYKQLLVDTVNNMDFVQRFTPAQILDDALDQMTAAKSQVNAFFWSDMLPSKAPYRTNTYTFNNDLDTAIYPLTQVYNFTQANYNGVLVYLTRTVEGLTSQTQLLLNVDYTISTDSPSLTVTIGLLAGDQITIKEYNQTYGSYIPNTPTKLGVYPAYEPAVVLDSDYTQPTYFIKGHDGSYTKLYGEYIAESNTLVDFRDQALLEFEKRIYNNLKLSTTVPIERYEVVPGFFRDPTYSWNEFLEIYSESFLNWVGQNRLDYKTQYYNKNDEYTYNYVNSGNKLDKAPILQGYWRGVYEYFYDTTTPNTSPWEMLGFVNQPTWWTDRYGPAPYTSENLILWTDLEQGYIWNNGDPYYVEELARPGLLNILPVDSAGNLISPLNSIVGNYNPNTFQRDWKVGDDGPVELSYRRSSSYPFDLTRIFALTRPAEFFNLAVDLDNYKYSEEFNQYLVDNRSHLNISNIQIYGNGTAKTSYINWIVDYEKQLGIDATTNITELLDNLDVRLIYRLAGYSDKTLLKFYVEKGTPNSRNASLLIPDESYAVLLYDNQPFDRLSYSGVIIQQLDGAWAVYGNSQNFAYFTTLAPLYNGKYTNINVEGLKVKVTNDYQNEEVLVPYGTRFYSVQEVSQFIMSYGAWLKSKGMIFDEVQNGLEVTWQQMINEFLYWTQTGWENGSVVTLNPSATLMKIDKESTIVQPLTVQQQNFILNQNLYPISLDNLCVQRDGTLFSTHTLNQGDAMSYAQFNMSNFEHGIVFDNVTLFNDIIYNLTTGLRQSRINVRGTKTAEWNGTVNAYGFILNQDNVQEWSRELKYVKGQIVLYKNKYWTALKIIEPSNVFRELDWKEIDYEDIQKGLLPNSSTRSYESTLYYDVNQANLEQDANLLGYSLIGYRPRDYLALADLTDVTQVNVYKNLIKNKGTRNAVEAFRGANLPQGGIDYEVYENWAIKQGEYGGVLNDNFVEFRVNQNNMTGNPSIVSLTEGMPTVGSMQEVPLYSLFNYGRPVNSPNVLSTVTNNPPNDLYPDAGYVNFDDVKMASYFFAGLPRATDKNNQIVPIQDFYVRDYLWLANFKERWDVYSWKPAGQIVEVRNNLNNTATVRFANPHNLSKLKPLAIINFAPSVDGYYIVTNVVNTLEVIINLIVVNASQTSLQGRGIGLTFESQRVATPSEIGNVDLLEAEFSKNTVWVDENSDGDWAVYRKNINYQYLKELSRDPNGDTFGSAVAYTSDMGYLIGDANAGELYRYAYNALTSQYDLAETITEGTSFGSTIVYANNVYAVSEPTSGTPKVYVYTLNNSTLSDDIVDYQTISAPGGVTNWGSELALSNDTNWLYISDIDNNQVYVYRRDQIQLTAGFLTVGQTYTITTVGDTDWVAAGAIEGKVGITFVATTTGSALVSGGTTPGIAMQVTYNQSAIIDGSVLGLVSGDNFGKAMSTDNNGDVLVVSAPNKDYSASITDWGSAYVYQRTVQNIEAQYNSLPNEPQIYQLAWTPDTTATTVSATNATGNLITLASATGISVNDPIIFTGIGLTGTGINGNTVYYVRTKVGNDITIKTSRSTTDVVTVATVGSISNVTATAQTTPLYVTVNGVLVQDNNYAVVGSSLYYTNLLRAGDIVNVSGNEFNLLQTFTSDFNDRTNIQFGYDLDITAQGADILIGSPLEINNDNVEGAVYRYTNGGAKYGVVIGTNECNVTTNRKLLINGYLVFLSAGNATVAANTINTAQITNVEASATSDNKLIIQVINKDLTIVNEKLVVTAFDNSTLSELGLEIYTNTQIITCPHEQGPTMFGATIKFNEFDSVVISAPVGTRYAGTTFDFTDDENLDNDTVFDNNATRFVDSYQNAGAVYMFDYLDNYNESLVNPGKFVYAQSVNSQDQEYGAQPMYGTALDFNEYQVVIGTPGYQPGTVGGEIIVYTNSTGIPDWSIFRQSAPIVDINKIQNTQLFSAETNNTLINLDYMDPLQGKLLGAVRQNIDYVSSVDPAKYNSDLADQSGYVWSEAHVGQIWFNTNNVRWLNYHQDDVVYNSERWGQVFPGSDVAVYTWVSSFVPPNAYPGPGIPLNISLFSVSSTLNASNVVVPVYYFWVRNTNLVATQRDKTLSDTIIANYIANPRGSGIAYMAPLLPNTFGLYNSLEYINANDTVFHVGYSNGTSSDVSHQEFALIRENYADDFLPGIPQFGSTLRPEGLYDRLLDSLSGVDEAGAVVPNPFLPKAVQSGILARPRQSFFYNRYLGLKNYLLYANTVLAQFPIAETRREASFLFAQGEFYNTTDYWEYVNWWATGYDDNTKSALQVSIYADLAALNVATGTLVTVEQNGEGKFEVYRYDGSGVWTRVGLENGTIQFKVYLWDYAEAKLGFSGDFFDTTSYDSYPSEETRYIVRALNEQIYVEDLLTFRNKSLILLFEYIQTETTESQNFLPWLNKTSLVDVAHKIRELRPIEVFQSDNQDFLAGYINEVKPYHVVVKEFLFKYTGEEVFEGNITDFDLPAQYNSQYQKYITPQLVYTEPNNEYEYGPTNEIWSNAEYNQWFANKGVSITGQPNYEITVLTSYLNLSSSFILVDNVQGFPINGTIRIGNEEIGYSQVDRALNLISGLIRGVNGTPIVDHIPGEKIYIDLPAVLLLNGGRGYTEPPKVTAYIDQTLYPAPTRPAVLEAVMSLDSVLQVNVIDPGQGYAVLPEIRIDPALQIFFTDTAVNSSLHTINIYAPNIRTGDLVQYKDAEDGTGIGKLINNQWYYVNVLENNPSTIVALYSSYSDAVDNKDRIEIFVNGTADTFSLNLGARASAITTASPVRENNITLRFDRTTYRSQVQDWVAGAYYGSFFAGSYYNSENVASASIQLQSTQPPIENILASAQGVAFEIVDVENDQEVNWSTFERTVAATVAANDVVRLSYSSTEPNASGSTIGFTVGMPVKFIGAAFGGITEGVTYYVAEVINDSDFSIMDENGTVISLTDATVSAQGLTCLVASVVNTAVLTVNYPGILTVTATEAGTNKLTVPISAIGTGGTRGFYVNLPVFFSAGGFGGITENLTYYIRTVVDDETFTISENDTPTSTTAYSAASSTDIITVESTEGFSVNDPIIFNTMVVAGTASNTFGNIVSGTTYYVSQIVSDTQLKISTLVNGSVFDPGNVSAASNTNALLTNQFDTVTLTTATGEMIMNVSLPVSPGQVNGQLFTLYETSEQYPAITSGTISNLIERTINATIATVDRIAIPESDGGTDNFYVNMPLRVDSAIGGLTTATNYYIIEYSGMEDPLNPGEYLPNIQVEVTNTSASTDELTCDTTESLYVRMPIVFTGVALGGIVIGQEYFVQSITSPTTFKISETPTGTAKDLTGANGIMVGTGDPYIVVSTSIGGGAETLSSSSTGTTSSFTQFTTGIPEFDISYVLGGYRAIITDPGSGFAINNTITISGAEVGGTSPTNDITLTVNTINSTGQITDVICSGTVPGLSNQYYLKVLSPNTLGVYSDPLMTVPVSGIGFNYVGFTTASVTGINSSTDTLTIADTSVFNVNDAIVFTGDTTPTSLVAGNTYYILDIVNSTTFTVSDEPGGSLITMPTTVSVDFTVAKAGSFALLPEPFYFNQSIVKFNGRVYICIISNNDDEFVFGKWELLDSGDRRLNALDRTIGYYQPTINMPGVDLTQLFEGITYPNSIYLGNPFEPGQQFELDTVLTDQPFYPTEVDVTSVVWNGTHYLAAANLPDYSAVLGSASGDNWAIAKLTNIGVGATDIIYAGGYYVMTSTNSATPVFRSNDGITWTTNGYFTPWGSVPYDTIPYDMTSISIAALALNSVAYRNGYYVAVGDNIVRSDDTYIWREVNTFQPEYNNQLYGVDNVEITAFNGFIAVGKGKRPDYSTGVTLLVDTNLILYSNNDGLTWTTVPSLTPKGLYAIADNGSVAVAVGESGIIYYTNNGANWLGVNEVSIISINETTNQINVTNTAGFAVNDVVRFSAAVGGLSTGTSYYVVNVVSGSQIQVSTTLGGSPVTLVNTTVPEQTMMYLYEVDPLTLRDVTYANGVWVAVGDEGVIKTSSDYLSWSTVTSGTVENLNGINYNITDSTFIAVGDNNTILVSDDNGVTWTSSSLFTVAPTVYDVKGADFPYGYGPEELVPGVVTDNLTMIVTTRPGTNWPVTEYAHTGYKVVSTEMTPTSASQTEYSFAEVLQYPAQVFVQVLDATTGLGTTLPTSEYTVDWLNKVVVLNTPLDYLSPSTQSLRLDVYEVGNGDQLVKSNSDTDPIRTNIQSGFNEIYLNCNYSETIFQGSGVIRTGSHAIEVEATATDGTTDRITCVNVSDFTVNDPITFQGVTFGNIQEETTYYVKTVSVATSTITVSDSYNSITGTAGPTFSLATATGSMIVNIQTGTGTVWTDPIVFLNGTKLVLGKTNTISRTKASNNAITTNSTGGLIVGTPIMFDNFIFGGVIQPMTTYYIHSIIDGNEFTISATQGGPILTLPNATGGSRFITGDYAFMLQPNGQQAKMVFANDSYSNDTDYLVYSVFGETIPEQYGYTIPEVQEFTGDGSSSQFILDNFIGEDNPKNAIVEINGIRQTISQYTIDSSLETITFDSPPANGSTISVTTFNDTDRQYLNTQYGITGTPGSAFITFTVTATNNSTGTFDQDTPTVQSFDQDTPSVVSFDENLNWLTVSSSAGLNVNDSLVLSGTAFGGLVAGQTYYVVEIWNSTEIVISEQVGGTPLELTNDTGTMTSTANGLTVAAITNINNNITPPIASTFATATDGTTEEITVDSTDGFIVNQPVIFKGTSFGDIATDGTVYFVESVVDSTTFTIKDQDGNTIDLSTATGNMLVEVGGTPTIRITTAIENAFEENTLIRIDGVSGAIQLNNNTYYAKIINKYTFDIYTQPYDPALYAVNSPVTSVSAYTGGGYAWRAGLFYLVTTVASATSSSDNRITVDSVEKLVVGTPVEFTQVGYVSGDTIMGGLVQGQTYYIKEVFPDPVNKFTVTATRNGNEVVLTTYSGTNRMNVTQWEQVNVDRLWVTVNGYRVPSSKLRVNSDNEVSILTQIVPGNEVIITSMIPHATPDEEIYLNFVNQINEATVYRANTETRTWLTQPIYELDTEIFVGDVRRLTDVVVQNVTAPSAVNGYYNIGLTADKRIIATVQVVNNTTGDEISSSNFEVVIEELAPILKISAGSYITAGDSLTITTLEGNTVFINGEQIKFGTIDFANNSLGQLQRGANGTAIQTVIPQYSEVYSLLSNNELPSAYYNQTWNSDVFNTVDGDPLQISETAPAEFLHVDIT
jgi:hypothetical protein